MGGPPKDEDAKSSIAARAMICIEGDVSCRAAADSLALLWQNFAIDLGNWIERSRYRGVNGEVA
jgi:hypothetical protein